MHLNSILREYQFSVVLDGKLIKSEEAEVAEDHVHSDIISISSYWVSLEEYFNKDSEKLLIPGATVENLLDKYLLIGVFRVGQELISV